MQNVYTSNYEDLAAAKHAELFSWGAVAEYFTAQFERDNAAALVGCEKEDVGAVVLYMRGDEEVAYFDYERFVGLVR